MEHFVTFPYTFTREQETNMAVASMMTCKICLCNFVIVVHMCYFILFVCMCNTHCIDILQG